MKINGVEINRICGAMLVFGGSFACALANAALRADSGNLQRIVEAFPELFDKYSAPEWHAADVAADA